MKKELSLDLIYKNHNRVVFKFGDLYPGSLLKVLKNAITQRETVDYPDVWFKLVTALGKAFGALDEYLIFVSPLHTTSSHNRSIEEELDELRTKNGASRIFIEGETSDRKYFCFGVTDREYLEDLIYRYYDSGIKIFLQKAFLKKEEVISALSSMKFEEGELSPEVFSIVIEISFPSGKEFYMTAKPDNEFLIKEVIEKFSDSGQ